jgi:quinol monooxygenase YgiN
VSALVTQTSLFVKMVFQDGKRDEGVATLETMLPQVATEPGTLVYSFHLDSGDENTVWIFELYTDGDALGVHGGSDAIKAMFGKIGGLFAEPPTMIITTPVGGNKGLPS